MHLFAVDWITRFESVSLDRIASAASWCMARIPSRLFLSLLVVRVA